MKRGTPTHTKKTTVGRGAHLCCDAHGHGAFRVEAGEGVVFVLLHALHEGKDCGGAIDRGQCLPAHPKSGTKQDGQKLATNLGPTTGEKATQLVKGFYEGPVDLDLFEQWDKLVFGRVLHSRARGRRPSAPLGF